MWQFAPLQVKLPSTTQPSKMAKCDTYHLYISESSHQERFNGSLTSHGDAWDVPSIQDQKCIEETHKGISFKFLSECLKQITCFSFIQLTSLVCTSKISFSFQVTTVSLNHEEGKFFPMQSKKNEIFEEHWYKLCKQVTSHKMSQCATQLLCNAGRIVPVYFLNADNMMHLFIKCGFITHVCCQNMLLFGWIYILFNAS